MFGYYSRMRLIENTSVSLGTVIHVSVGLQADCSEPVTGHGRVVLHNCWSLFARRQRGAGWRRPAGRSGGWLSMTIRCVLKCVYNRRSRVRRHTECWSAVVKAVSISNNQCMYAQGQQIARVVTLQKREHQELAMMECLSSSAMSPDCSSSGSESSLTASAPSTPGSSPDYLAQLLKDRKHMQAFSNVFIHLDRILEDGELFELR